MWLGDKENRQGWGRQGLSASEALALLKNGDFYQSIKGQSSKVNSGRKQGHLASIN